MFSAEQKNSSIESSDADLEIVVRLQSGDDRAFDELMDRYKRPVVNFVYRMLNDAGDADDVAQEVFVRVYRSIKRFRADGRYRFSTWLFQIARNQAIDVLRKRKRRPLEMRAFHEEDGDEPVSPGRSADREAHVKEVGEAVARAVSVLPEKQKTVLILSEYHDHSHAEIASIMECSVKSVESRLARAREALRRRLAYLEPSSE